MALPPHQRLTRTDIQKFFSGSRHSSSQSAHIRRTDFSGGKFYVRRGVGAGNVRLAVIVPKSVSKKSVMRNRLKRRTVEWFRKYYKSGGPVDIIVSMGEGARTMKAKDLYREFELFQKKNH